MKFNFEEVKRKRIVRGPCRECGAKTTHTLSVMNTVNPFNKDERGIPKSRQHVWDDVSAKLRETR